MDAVRTETRLDTKAASNRRLVEFAAGLLRFDELFSRWSWGRGVMLSAHRNQA